MKNLSNYRDLLFLLFSIAVFLFVLFNITSDFLKTKAATEENANLIVEDPSKDFKSLNNYISYSVPADWKKIDQVDTGSGSNTLIALTSPDFESSASGAVRAGVRITINRSYELKPEETLKSKLNSSYQFYDYNIRALTLDNKSAMTMHEDYNGHFRFVFVANGDHLWQIAITAKSLEDEQKYEKEINSFLASVKFKG